MPENTAKVPAPLPSILHLPHPDTLRLDVYERRNYWEFIGGIYEIIPQVFKLNDEDCCQSAKWDTF